MPQEESDLVGEVLALERLEKRGCSLPKRLTNMVYYRCFSGHTETLLGLLPSNLLPSSLWLDWSSRLCVEVLEFRCITAKRYEVSHTSLLLPASEYATVTPGSGLEVAGHVCARGKRRAIRKPDSSTPPCVVGTESVTDKRSWCLLFYPLLAFQRRQCLPLCLLTVCLRNW